jgi:hypothetical protein|tara:strand:- start:16973 stop:17092 length:120 start_codon:yes stop_codon:yes gene_type:complete
MLEGGGELKEFKYHLYTIVNEAKWITCGVDFRAGPLNVS